MTVNALRRGTVAGRGAVAVTTVASDTFGRADGVLGTADVGGAWSVLSNTWAISGNAARLTAGTVDTQAIAMLPAGAAASLVVVDVMLSATNAHAGLVLRGTDINSYMAVQMWHATGADQLRISKRVSGVSTYWVTTTPMNFVAGRGYTLAVLLTSTTVTAYVDGVASGNYTFLAQDNTDLPGTRVGLRSWWNPTTDEDSGSRWDDLTATTATTLVPRLPAPPIAPTATVVDSTTVTVAWTQAGNGSSPLTSYTVTSSAGPTFTGISAAATTFNATGLTSVAQTFTVTAVNTVGSRVSVASNSVTPVSSIPFAKYCAPGGSNSNPGTIGAPYLTIQKLADNLSAGQNGAIRGGTYTTSAGGMLLQTTVGGTSGNLLRLIGYPGDSRPQLVGGVELNTSYTSLENVDISLSNSGSNLVPIGIARAGVAVTGAQFYSCIIDGADQSVQGIMVGGTNVQANNCVFAGCIIHNVLGGDPTPGPGHGIYWCTGTGLQVYGCIFYDIGFAGMWGGDYGMQLYPSSSFAVVQYNTIDHCTSGIVYGDEPGTSTSTDGGHNIHHTIVSNLVNPSQSGGSNGHSAVNAGNTVTPACTVDNCHWYNNANGNVTATNTTESATTTGDPLYVNAAARNYRLNTGSPAVGKGAYASTTPPLSPSV